MAVDLALGHSGGCMRLIRTRDPRSLWLGRAEPGDSFASPTDGAEFALLLVLGESAKAGNSGRFVAFSGNPAFGSGARHVNSEP